MRYWYTDFCQNDCTGGHCQNKWKKMIQQYSLHKNTLSAFLIQICHSFWCSIGYAMSIVCLFGVTLIKLLGIRLMLLYISVGTSVLSISQQYVKNNPIVKVWKYGIRKKLGWQIGSLLSPVYPSHFFSPSVIDDTFNMWRKNRIVKVKALYTGERFSKTHLISILKIPLSLLLQYIKTLSFPNLPEKTQMASVLFWRL